MAKMNMPRVVISELDVHFDGPPKGDGLKYTLCGIGNLHAPNTRREVNCPRCRELHRYVMSFRREACDRATDRL